MLVHDEMMQDSSQALWQRVEGLEVALRQQQIAWENLHTPPSHSNCSIQYMMASFDVLIAGQQPGTAAKGGGSGGGPAAARQCSGEAAGGGEAAHGGQPEAGHHPQEPAAGQPEGGQAAPPTHPPGG